MRLPTYNMQAVEQPMHPRAEGYGHYGDKHKAAEQGVKASEHFGARGV